MAIANTTLQNFASGELSPKMRGRYDLPLYFNGAERQKNFISETQGPAKFRTGTIFVTHTRLNKVAILIPFQFNDEQSYLLEFTDLKMRVYRNNGFITEDAKAVTGGATQADPVVVTLTAHGYSNGDEVFITGVVGMTELNGKTFLVANVTANTFELTDIDGVDIDGTGFGVYVSGGTVAKIFELTTPYTEAQLFEFKFAQNADTMYIVHPSHDVRKLTRTDHNAWTLATFVRTADPFGSVDNHPSAVAFYEGRIIYAATNNNPEQFWGSRAPNTTTGAPRLDDFTTGANADDSFTFTLAPSNGKVDKIEWISGTDSFLAMGTFGGISKVTGDREDSAITPGNINVKPLDDFGCADVTPIRRGNTIIYVQRGERTIRSFEFDVLADTFVSVDRNLVSDHFGFESPFKQIEFSRGRPDILWSVRDDGELIGVTFKSREDVSGWWRAPISGTDAKVLSVGVMPRPADYDQIWIVAERTINSVTRRYVEFYADEVVIPERIDFFTGAANEDADDETWRRAMFEAQKGYKFVDSSLSYDGTDAGTDASATMTPSATTGTGINFTASAAVFVAADVGREIWKKAIDGVGTGRATITAFTSTTVVVCTITVDFDTTTAMAAGNWYLTANTISGLDHLEAEVVKIITDGGTHPDETVASGAITLDAQSSRFHVGKGYEGLYKSMNLEVGGVNGPAQTKPKNINRINLRFLNTLGARYGTDIYKMQDVVFRSTGDHMDRPPPLFTGDKELHYEDTTTNEKHVIIQQMQPLPCVIQMIVPFVDTDNF